MRGGLELALPAWFRPRRVLAYLGRDPASPMEKVSGRVASLGLWAAGRPVAAHVELQGRRARCRLEARGRLPDGAVEEAQAQLVRLLGLAVDPLPFERRAADEPEVARLVAGRAGLSIPQTASFFDGLVWVVAGQQVSLPVAYGMRRRLAERVGASVGDGLVAPPRAEDVAELEPRELRRLGFSRNKAEYLSALARYLASGELDPDALARQPPEEIERTLLGLRGLGPWSVGYLMMRALALADCVPVGDVGLARGLVRFHGLAARPAADEMRRLMAPFAPHRSLATFHFWELEKEPE